MHILPQSRCGIYGFAGIAWLAGAMLCWLLAAPVPRFVMDPVEYPGMWLSEDGRRILHYEISYTDTPLWFGTTQQPRAQGPLRTFNTSNGNLITSHAPTEDGVALDAQLGLLIVREKSDSTSPFSLVDLIGGGRTPLTWHGVGTSEPCAARGTADGRFVVLVVRRSGKYETVWWDRFTQTSWTFTGIEPLALAADGRWLTRGVFENEYCVRDPNSDAIVSRFVSQGPVESAYFWADGACVLVGASQDWRYFRSEIFETNSGRHLLASTKNIAGFGLANCNSYIELDDFDPNLLVELHEKASHECIRKSSIRDYGPSCRHKEIWTFPSDRYMMVNWGVGSSSAFGRFIANVPLIGDYYDGDEIEYYVLIDSQTADVVLHFRLPYSLEKRLSPDGRSLLARRSSDDRWCMWDVPPRKSKGWMLGVATWTVMVLVGARWRTMKLKSQ